jgi:hypothetical protein
MVVVACEGQNTNKRGKAGRRTSGLDMQPLPVDYLLGGAVSSEE